MFSIGAEILITPYRTCIRPGCPKQGHSNTDRKSYAGYLYTLRRGVLPVRILTLYCRGCNTTYRPNYHVHRAEQPIASRNYNAALVPQYLEVTEHTYVERELVVLFRNQMAFSHTSAEAAARIYNLSIRKLDEDKFLRSEMVWHGFFLHALLQHHTDHSSTLILPHQGANERRLDSALHERNLLMVGTGQKYWAHACEGCSRVVKDPDGAMYQIDACVMDGVTLGHPRCNVSDCTNPLQSSRNRFCKTHQQQEYVCAIEGCISQAAISFRTCDDPSHHNIELRRREQGQAIFRLKARLARATTGDTGNDLGLASNHNNKSHSASGASRVKTSLSRKWTHNEQLMVRCCGVIVSRATFYNAESPSNAADFVAATFPSHLPRGRPSYLFYDNSCSLLRHLRASADTRLSGIALVVDVFHAVNKHKDTDTFCQMHCNPAGFPDLYDQEEGWLYNSSAAEQTNIWFGGFQSITKDMSEIHYNFFLDEMIAIRNDFWVSELLTRGKKPHIVPYEELVLA
ncbi:hypothetical protein CERSUDRAFT_58618 [Gelatoporia subvermispora B]|uniref:CxC5 like cysteine cluster associated with KDZ domain-containing protein n=1 Tax=Ceriporiopsis subvermispora (strain B) TaxID=914234 RepID=M2QJR1_CERS8|nr:hypothetical protein CERSUDRAFT_58618 [Gelatoporia subvermispora B]